MVPPVQPWLLCNCHVLPCLHGMQLSGLLLLLLLLELKCWVLGRPLCWAQAPQLLSSAQVSQQLLLAHAALVGLQPLGTV